MIRRKFIKGISFLGAGSIWPHTSATSLNTSIRSDREYWISMLLKIAEPVLTTLSDDVIKQQMPVEAVQGTTEERKKVTYLEAIGRTLAGLAPWLELGPDGTTEGKLREKFIKLSISSIHNSVSPGTSSFMNFTEGAQPLVDAAFLAHALLRAPKQLWSNLDKETQTHLIAALKSTRIIKPYFSNWLLFTAIIEAALLKFHKDYDAVRIDYAIQQHEQWYKGDGVYGDGPDFHYDYYNSYVIQPMLLDIVKTINQETGGMRDLVDRFTVRAKRYAAIQERLISPEGTFPPVGRSIAYRCGAFQLLAQMALQKQLPEVLLPSQVRSALTAVIRRTMEASNTFDKNGWLTIGLCGHQPGVGEGYISTGSLYLCTVAFLPLGLPTEDVFWSGPAIDWTSKKAFSGAEFPIDKALTYSN
ncbi:DUF2264 domain-containing protein [Chryseosolibacter indicus]|uniref:DUF2264 domain-containing protein n=1 Tax=Chryseosolibacter indicus TaxID=2782351 RepID=A0ABS5VPL3_9BACT|nr:DUF2264 domain-containing protein [Chryseosolibacter indicus]MBT1703378.1 DUF2264 domain-containing protein [Chryseosolibacter indicus]